MASFASMDKASPMDHWSRYWGSGAITSLPQDFRANYDGEIAAFWYEQFKKAPQGAHLLDACCGNGALAFLAAEYSADRKLDFSIIALDAAEINPGSAVHAHGISPALVSRVQFIQQTPLEEWSGKERSLDLIISQYGIEYCDQEQIAPQLAKTLKAGGRLAMLCHADSTDIRATMRAEANDYAHLDQLQILTLLWRWSEEQLDSDELRHGLKAASRQMEGDLRIRQSPLMRNVSGMLRHLLAMSDDMLQRNRDAVRSTCQELESGRSRLEDMIQVHTRVARKAWYRPWIDAGLVPESQGELLYRNRHHVGCYYTFYCSDSA